MSLDLALVLDGAPVYSVRLTAAVEPLARAAGLYAALWCPRAIGVSTASELAGDLRTGLAALRKDPASCIRLGARQGMALYKVLVDTVDAYLAACLAHPEAQVVVRQ